MRKNKNKATPIPLPKQPFNQICNNMNKTNTMGRKRSNPVYREEFFQRDGTDPNIYICQCYKKVKEKDCTIAEMEEALDDPRPGSTSQNFLEKKCLEKIQGQWGPTNLEKHIEKKHPEDFEKLRIKKTKKNSETPAGRRKMNPFLLRRTNHLTRKLN